MAGTGAKLATGWLELTVSAAGAQKSITDTVVPGATKAGNQAGSSIGAQLLGGLKKFAGPIAAVVAGFSVVSLVKSSEKAFMDLMGTTNAMQRVMGGTKEQVSGMNAAIGLSGVDSAKAQTSMTIFSKTLGNAAADSDKAAAMTAKLGTSFLDAAGNVKPMSEILPGLSDRFKSMPDGAEKTALATQLFGRSGAAMLPFLNKGSESIGELTEKAKQMGLVVDDVSGKAFANAKVSQREYSMSLQGLMSTLGGNLLPITTAFGNVYRQMIIPVIQAATGFLAQHRDRFIAVGDAVQGFADRAGSAIKGVLGFFTAGDSTYDLANALGLSDTSFVVQAFFTIREGLQGLSGAIGPIFQQIGASFAPVFAQLGPLFASLLPVFGQLLGPLVELWAAFSPLTIIIQSLTPVLPTLVGLLGQVAAVVGGVLGQVLTSLIPPLVDVATVLTTTLAGAFTSLMPAITSLIPVVVQIVQIIGGVFGQVLQALVPIITMIVGLFAQLLPQLMPLVGAILGLVEPIGQLIVGLMPLVGALLPPLVELLGVLLTPILGLIEPIMGLLVPALQFVAQVLGVVIGWVSQAITWLVKFVTGNQQAGAQFQTVWNNIMGFFRGIGRTIGDIWNGLITGVGQFVGRVVGFFQEIPTKIGELFAGAGQWLFDAGKNIVDGLINGAGSILSSIGNFFLDMVPDWIKEPFKAALGINSPSKVFYGYGDNTIQGYIDGVKARRGDIQREVEQAAPSMSPMTATVVGEAARRALGDDPSAVGGDTFVLQGITTEETAAELAARIERKKRRRARRSGALKLAGVS